MENTPGKLSVRPNLRSLPSCLSRPATLPTTTHILCPQDRIASLNGKSVDLVLRQDLPGFIRWDGLLNVVCAMGSRAREGQGTCDAPKRLQ